MALIKYPYTNLHELNLDWIIEQLNQEGAVLSVNDKHGIVVLTGEDIKRNSTTPETVAQALSSQGTAIQTVRTQIGTTPLPTTAQSLTGAIAENAGEIANIQDDVIGSTPLPTTAQTLTGAIAENANEISNVEDNVIGNTALPTTAQTLTGAIAENANEISNVEDNIIGNTPLPTTAQTLTGAIAEHDTDIANIETNLAQSYYDMKDSSNNAIGLIRFAGNKVAILTFTNAAGQIPSSGMQLPYTFKDDISTLCQYYDGNENTYGQLIVNKTGVVYVRKSGAYVNATYVLAQVVNCLT